MLCSKSVLQIRLILIVEELEESWKNKVCRDGKNLCGLLLDFDLDREKNKRTKKCRRVKSRQKLETQA